jgi:hypothetical protein
MKTAILAATAAVTLWGGIALAQDDSSTQQDTTQDTSPDTVPESSVRTPSTSQPTQDSWRDRSLPDEQTGVGGSGPALVQTGPSGQAEHQLQCNCRDLSTGTGGSGIITTPPAAPPPPADNGYQPLQNDTGNQNPGDDGYDNDQDNDDHDHGDLEGRREPGTGGSGDTVVVREGEDQGGPDLNGVTVLLGGGVEGYTGALAPRVGVGPTYGAALQMRPTDVLGLELAYSGGVHEIKDNLTHGVNASSGADIVRNGARAMLSLGVADTTVQPYVLGGVGVNWYSARGNAPAYGFQDDTSGEIPLGLGFRTQVGAFTADLRGLYDVPFDQDFAPGVTTTTEIANLDTSNDGRYQATLSIGANF